MYLNPVNATNQTFGCHGPLLVEFVAVYWLAPFLGTALAVVTQDDMTSLLKSLRMADDDHHVTALPAADVNKVLNGSKNYLRVGGNHGDESGVNGDHQRPQVMLKHNRRFAKKRQSLKQKC